MILKRNEATTRRGLGSWKVRAIASFECATEMPVESTSKRRCARRSRPTVSPPSPEGRGGQGVRTGTETGQGGEDPNGDGSGGEDPNGDGVRGGGAASIVR